MRTKRIGRSTRNRYPYRSLITKIAEKAFRDEARGRDVDWDDIPWIHEIDISVLRLKRAAKRERRRATRE